MAHGYTHGIPKPTATLAETLKIKKLKLTKQRNNGTTMIFDETGTKQNCLKISDTSLETKTISFQKYPNKINTVVFYSTRKTLPNTNEQNMNNRSVSSKS